VTGKPSSLTITQAIDLASNGIILAQAENSGVKKTGLLIPVEVVNKDKAAVNELKIAKMAEPGVLSGSKTLNITTDPDRFFIRIPGAANFGTSVIKIESVDNPDAEYNDNLTELELTAEGGDLITKSLLLVADDVDDDVAVDGVADDAKNDRTHKIQLGGRLKISAVKIGTNAEKTFDLKVPVNVKKTVKVKMVNCRYGLYNVDSCWPAETVTRVKKVMKERYAQVGVKLEISEAVGKIIDWTTGYLNDYPTLSGSVITIPQQSKDIIDANPVASGDEIGLYLVRKMPLGPTGVAIINKYTKAADKAAGYSNKAFVEVPFFPDREGTDYTAPHEVLHILLDAEHDDYPTEWNDSKMLWHKTIQNDTIDDTKRISVTQEPKVHTSPLAK
jgi:hypothetical protein